MSINMHHLTKNRARFFASQTH